MRLMRVGRKLASEDRTVELRKEIHRWFNTPRDQREPRTVQAFAEQHGMHRNTVYNLRRQSVDGLPNEYWGVGLERDQPLVQSLLPRPVKTPAAVQFVRPVKPPQPDPQQTTVPVAEPPWYWKKDWKSEDEIWASNQVSYEMKRQLVAEHQRREWAKQLVEWNAAK